MCVCGLARSKCADTCRQREKNGGGVRERERERERARERPSEKPGIAIFLPCVFVCFCFRLVVFGVLLMWYHHAKSYNIAPQCVTLGDNRGQSQMDHSVCCVCVCVCDSIVWFIRRH